MAAGSDAIERDLGAAVTPTRFRPELEASRSLVRACAVGASIFGIYVVAAVAGFTAPTWGAHFPISVLPAGLAIGALFRWGTRLWPLVAVAAALVALALGATWSAAALQGGATGAAAAFNVLMLRACGFRGDFQTPRGVAVFVAAAALGACTSVIAWCLAWWIERGFTGAWMTMPTRWWISTFNSVLVVAPLVISARPAAFRLRHATRRETLVWTSLVALTITGVILLPPSFNGMPLVIGLALLAWAVARLGFAYASAASIALCLFTAVAGAFASGLMSGSPAWLVQRLTWNTCLLYSLWVLGLNAFFAASERAERRYRKLFEQSPAPKWLTSLDGRRFLAVNAAAAATYGYSQDEFARLSVADVIVDAPSDAESADSVQLHRCKDGRLLKIAVRVQDVELDEGPGRLWYNVDVTEQARLRAELQRARSDERARLSREMHDGLGQELTGVSLLIAGLNARLRKSDPQLADQYDRVARLARSALETTRRIARGMAPLDPGESLASGLRRLTTALQGPIGACVSVEIEPEAESYAIPNHVADGLYRIGQEALSNALRHSGASNVRVKLRVVDGALVLRVRDDGAGFDVGQARAGLGLRTLGLRAEEIGCVLRVRSTPGEGTAVECRCLPTQPVTGPHVQR